MDSAPHILLFPFMSKGHTTPLLHFALTLLRRSISVTVVTTAANCPFIADFLAGTAASVVTLPFPAAATIPAGIESTDKLPSMSMPLFYDFASATSAMQPHFETLLETLPRVTLMVTDFFLWWTLHSAKKFAVPRLILTCMSCYSGSLTIEAMASGILGGAQPDDELLALTRFPWIKLSKEDFDKSFRNPKPGDPGLEFNTKAISSMQDCYGVLVNSFYELEPTFVDYLNTHSSLKYWCVGPFHLTQTTTNNLNQTPKTKPSWVTWLDEKLEEKQRVLYVAFGSQAEISQEQVEEIAMGLAESKVNFMWVVRKPEWALPERFEERVEGRGVVVREWVDQREILGHESVEGFVSHCGWNSVVESVCAAVPVVAWPMMAEQFLNARMVVEELGVGLRVETRDGSLRGFVERGGLRRVVSEVMVGETGERVRERVRELAHMAKVATREGGSSWSTLNSLLHKTCGSHSY
ncbi:hypothetical protein VNO78_16248 [Psophocarpus tetragonolobus]|uniref:Glycosyltransferase n=1 Tax=Psophocarpus tetragonolobus TaxID=3891 RepID=A0AAN9XKM0_PSOTE